MPNAAADRDSRGKSGPSRNGGKPSSVGAVLRRLIPVVAVLLVVLLLVDVGLVLMNTARAPAALSEQDKTSTVTVAKAVITLVVSPTVVAKSVALPTETPTPAPSAAPTATPTKTAPTPTTIPTLTPAPTPVLCTDTEGTVVTETIASKILNTNLPVQVYLPPCHDAAQFQYPALYLIQGTAYYIGEWMEDGVTRVADLQIHLGIVPPFIIVMPASDLDRGNASKYHWSTGGKGSWEDFIISELLPVIESKYGAWANREGRAIGGISRGGYWSLQIAFANPDVFGIVGGHSPSITSAQLIGVPANFSMLSFVKSTDYLRNSRIWLDAGDTDWARIGAGNLSRELEQLGITHTMSIGSGGHTDDYWASRMPDYVTWYASSFPKVILADSTRKTP